MENSEVYWELYACIGRTNKYNIRRRSTVVLPIYAVASDSIVWKAAYGIVR